MQHKNSVPRKRYMIVVTLFFSLAVAYMGRVIVSVLAANEGFLHDMGIAGQPVKVGLLMTAFLVAYGLSNFVLSPLGNKWGPRKGILIAMILCGISMILGGVATVLGFVIVSRILLGISNGLHYPLQNVFVKNWFPSNERGRANSVWVIGQSVAPAIAMPLFTYIIGAFGWRYGFITSAVLCLIPVFLLLKYTADTPEKYKNIERKELDYINGFDINVSAGKIDTVAEKTDRKLWDKIKLFARDYRYWLLVYWYMSMTFVFWGLISWLPAYLKASRGFSWVEMGWLSSLPFILSIMLKGLGGWAVDKTGRYAPFLVLALLAGGIGIYLSTIIDNKYIAAVLLALSFGITNMGTAPAWTLLQKIINTDSLAIAGGTMNGISNTVSAFSPLIIGLSISITGKYESGLYVLVGAAIIASFVAMILVSRKL
ncbi:MFS transporter [Salmonella enterica subsp. enterica serovar Aqua]|nr:MFS transporter [Salmonella enterica subsp. enterica serovar Aqua]